MERWKIITWGVQKVLSKTKSSLNFTQCMYMCYRGVVKVAVMDKLLNTFLKLYFLKYITYFEDTGTKINSFTN